ARHGVILVVAVLLMGVLWWNLHNSKETPAIPEKATEEALAISEPKYLEAGRPPPPHPLLPAESSQLVLDRWGA
ncbi:unnamed protein product, partial [Symbiodinium sp. CCMP2456]